jgi:GT2 family glycosyltransferase/glycosyltransferase involved in cell wall biosynthesis
MNKLKRYLDYIIRFIRSDSKAHLCRELMSYINQYGYLKGVKLFLHYKSCNQYIEKTNMYKNCDSSIHHIINLGSSDFLSEILYVFPVIDWSFRFQRPQHFARGLARQGYTVFYFTTSFYLSKIPGYSISSIENNLFEIKLHLNHTVNIYKDNLNSKMLSFLLKSISQLEQDVIISKKIIKIDHPFWIDLATKLNSKIIYDCMDDHEGFEDKLDHLIQLERKAITFSDYLVVSSDRLYQKFSKYNKNCTLVENACDFNFFSQVTKNYEVKEFKQRLTRNGVIGYFGAIANWFDVDIITHLAEVFNNYDIVLIGSTIGCDDVSKLQSYQNIHLLGEKKYVELPVYLNLFDVCLIPFKIIPLTLATNPVKLFEYLAQGKPVVSVDLPEVRKYKDVVYIAYDKYQFVDMVTKAMKDANDISLISKRINVAKNNSWDDRFLKLKDCIRINKTNCPKVSVIVLTYNNLSLTQKCLYSIKKYSNYDNIEIIVVDNMSSDGSREWLLKYSKDNKIKLLLNELNLGFSAGNNIGIKDATGDYIVILNNDTFVSPNWISNLLKYFKDSTIGMVGPVTNNIGNQAKIELPNYLNEYDFVKSAINRHNNYFNNTYEVVEGSLAFFCVMISREVINKVGLLDENFGRGWFEDDDYSIRAHSAGYRTIIADDVLVHHEHSATFSTLPTGEKLELFERNKKYFEAKHNVIWRQHVTRRY